MNKYAESALKAIFYIEEGYPAEDAWEKASCEFFEKGSTSQKKSCPKGAFLGIYSNDPKKKNGKNAKYAQAAVSILKTDLSKKYTAKELWSIVGKGKTHNSQMDIVLILWEYGKIK